METVRGFTILEIIITLFITSLVITFSFSLSDGWERRNVVNTASILRRYLEEAVILSSGSWGAISLRPDGALQIRTASSLRSISARNNITFTLRPSGRSLRIYPSGALTPGAIVIRGDVSCRVTLSLRGRVRQTC